MMLELTAWKSIPGAVRVAVWIWSIAVLLSAVGGAVAILFTLLSLATV